MNMKKFGFLSFGIVLVVAILSLQKDGMSEQMKRIFHEVAHEIEDGAVKVYQEIRSLVVS
jgi:hypothetical protein